MSIQVEKTRKLSQALIKHRAFKIWITVEFLPFYKIQKSYYICLALECYLDDIEAKKLGKILNKKQYQTKRKYVTLLKKFIAKAIKDSDSADTLTEYLASKYRLTSDQAIEHAYQTRIKWMKSLSFAEFLLLQR